MEADNQYIRGLQRYIRELERERNRNADYILRYRRLVGKLLLRRDSARAERDWYKSRCEGE